MPLANLAWPGIVDAQISQRFGENPADYPQWKGHPGLDLAEPVGSPVGPVQNGQVDYVGVEARGGLVVYVSHDWGRSYYAHLSRVFVSVGDQVQVGTVIAESGSSGESTGPHLHLGFYPYGEPYTNGYGGAVDPLPYLTPLSATQPGGSGAGPGPAAPASCAAQALSIALCLGSALYITLALWR